MSGELQTIPARHGVATFVPSGRTIKIINTYGKQVVSTWAFSLHAPPEEIDEDEEELEDEEDIEEKTKELKGEVEEGKGKEKIEKEVDKPKAEASKSEKKSKGKDKQAQKEEETQMGEGSASKETETTTQETDDPPEQAPDTPPNEKSTQNTEEKKPEKRTWSSYLPSIPYRSGGTANKAAAQPDQKSEEEQQATSKKWSSYLPTGKGFSSYVPNVQIPDSKGVVSAFKSSHYRDPNKSYAEQLYEFSKTPVGAGSIAAATGSGTASSLYAAYNAYTKMNPNKNDQQPMEYLSLPHTRTSNHRLVPEVNDTLLTNLRAPIMTLIEDTTPGAHDTLTSACDANLYTTLGIDKPEEHGSCAENLVLALKEINEKAGLKGTKAVGADITVNIAPTPLHLFMNAPLEVDTSPRSEGAGARGAELKVDEPKGKKRSFVRFRAERDIVVVLSACPMDVGKQNGGRCMAANFMVEEADEEEAAASTSSLKKTKGTPKKIPRDAKKAPAKAKEEQAKPSEGQEKKAVSKKPVPRKDSAADNVEKKDTPAPEEAPKPKKKPKKLERRGGTATPSKSESS